MGKWVKLIQPFSKQNDNVKINPPATEAQISEVEERLHVVLPAGMRALLLEMNGDNWFVFSTAEIIETNLCVRRYDCFMPFDGLLFIAGNGCGDYFGYPITPDGINDSRIYMWDHETDDRTWKADGLKDAITKYYGNDI